MLAFNIRFLTLNVLVLVVLVASAVGLGRLLPGGARISFVQTRGDDSEIFALDINYALAVNLTRSPGRDFSATWSPDGRRMAFVSARAGRFQLYLFALGEGARLLGDEAAISNHPVWSPDGKSIVYEVERGNIRHLWIVDVDQPLVPGENPRALAASQTDDRLPAWSPDGARIAFVSLREGNAEIYTIAPDGSHLVNLTRHPGWDVNPAWSPDGTQIAFFALRDRYRELYVMDRDGGNVRQLTQAQEVNNGNYWGAPAWSPDGTRIAYQTVLDGSPEIIVTTLDTGQDYRLTQAQDVNALPVWLPDGRGIVYMSGRGMASALYLVDVDGGSPRRLTPSDAISQYPVLWSMGGD